ncbi:MAG: tRNA (adenosine(37)-N6)-threonylcarbamoyltransferase complex dimerization subunit type 1 TsaB [Rhodospirillales bacterium]|nr:tRNA (adenosine(37)-N6)-threonylcarbamoyltransferase complex dimerization subunit type 1 TsaB [Rhodospirillales bacterium]
MTQGPILAFDCAGGACSAVAWRDGRALARSGRTMTHGQAEVLVPMIRATLDEAGIGFGDLAAIATTLGPGSFTGLRAGLATARGLALATGLPCYGFSTLAIAARAVSPAERSGRRIAAAIDTRRDDLFVQVFDGDARAIGEGQVVTIDRAAAMLADVPVVLAGDATAALSDRLRRAGADAIVAAKAGVLDVAIVAELAAARHAAGAPGDAMRPLYLRAPDVTPAPVRRG